MTATIETQVVIVGGGPVGLALALDLAYRGNRCVVVERDRGTAVELLAKAGTLNERTMEFCRRWGIAAAVANAGFPDDWPRDNVYCTSLTGFLIGRDPLPSTRDRRAPPYSPEMLRKCPQHLFDPLLANAVRDRGLTEIRYNLRFDRLEQDSAAVTGYATDLNTNTPCTLRSQYLVACDGAGSGIRRSLDIPFEGVLLDFSVSAMVRMPHLDRYHDKGRCERFLLIGPQGTWANLTAVDGRDLWRFTIVGSEDKLDPRRLDIEGEIRKCLGREGIPFEIVRVAPWLRTQCVARDFRAGRVLFAGDSVHTTSPTGGHGLNTGIGDVSDLGWMLDALLHGWGGEYLLDAYHRERRPVAIRNSTSSTRNYKSWVESSGRDKVLEDSPAGQAQRDAIYRELHVRLAEEWHSHGIGLGYRYEGSPAIVPDGSPPPPDLPSEYIPTSRPGHRAPHGWLPDGRSILDLFGKGFVLLRFGAQPVPVETLLDAAVHRRVPLCVVDIDEAELNRLYERRLVLVRPDGQVAWRGDNAPADADAVMEAVRGNKLPTGTDPPSGFPTFVVPE